MREETNEIEFTNRNKNYRLHFISYLAILFSSYQLYTAIFGSPDLLIHRPIHLAFALGLVYLLFPYRKEKQISYFDWVLSFASIGLGYYSLANYDRYIRTFGKFEEIDIIVGIVGILLVLEACRRVIGKPLLIIVSVFIVYGLYGNYFPGFLSHKGYSLERVTTHLYLTTEGIMGIPLGASATFIFLFLIFGTLLQYTGVADYFLRLSMVLMGTSPGGPAKGAVLSSALFGSISGSSIANVMSTGSFTIPMMKRLGYRREFAGSVEAAASTGGQLMPPVMGTAAFIMAEFLGISYWTVVTAAIIPGILYYLGIFAAVHFEARRSGLVGMKRADLPDYKKVLMQSYMSAPLIAIVIFLAMGMTPIRSSLYAMVIAILVGLINPDVKITLRGFIGVLEATGKSALSVVVATANAGIIVGIVTLTGLGMKMGNGLIGLAGNNLLLILIFVAITALVLGMGVPTAPNYIITSMVAAPALIAMDVPPLAASMFVLYFGIISDVTPPVCLAAFAASAIAKSDLMKTGIEASRLAIGGFIIPFLFVINPTILLIDFNIIELTFYTLVTVVGMISISSALVGFLLIKSTRVERILLILGGILSIIPGYISSIPGVLIILGIISTQIVRKNRINNIKKQLI